jgi:SAM-dependent methyltransferase
MDSRKIDPPEFDQFAGSYHNQLKNPIRDLFAKRNAVFFERKLEVLREFYARLGVVTETLSWLDLGCGTGDLLRIGKHCFREVAGCDVSGEMLGQCGEIPTRRQPSPIEVPFEAESHDLVTAVCVYHHVLPAYRAALTREVVRVLKPGGVFCIVEHNPFNPAVQAIVRMLPMDRDAQLLTAGAARTLLRRERLAPVGLEYFLLVPEMLYGALGRLEQMLSHLPLAGQYALFARKSAGTS